jgi:hypothetical protein
VSFLFGRFAGLGVLPDIALAINADAPPRTVPRMISVDVASFESYNAFTLGLPNPPLTGLGVVDGVMSCGSAYWPHVYWDAHTYGYQNPEPLAGGGYGPTIQVVGVIVNSSVFLDGPGFPFTPPNWLDPIYTPPPEFHLLWNPDGLPIVDYFNPGGGQAGAASWDGATNTLTIVPQTYHPTTTFGPQGIELLPPPIFINGSPLVVPPVFGAGARSAPDPTILGEGLVIPPVFGGTTITPGSPSDPPPDDVPPPPDQDPYGPPEGRPNVDSGGAIPGADVTGRSGAVRVSRVRPVGGW